MKKTLNILGILALTVAISSCSVTLPLNVSNAPIGERVGKSESGVLFGIFYLNGNYGIKEAASNGEILGGIATVDERTQTYVIFSKKTLIVTGE